MSELNALRTLARVEKDAKAAETVGRTASKLFTKTTGEAVDISRGFNVTGPDGKVIPFKAGTEVPAAREWTKNFYNEDYTMRTLSSTKEGDKQVDQILLHSKSQAPVQRDEGVFDDYPAEVMAQRDGEEYRIRNTHVAEEYRGKGIAAGMYRLLFEKAKKEGRKVVSDSRLSPQAVAIWERMKELGYPINSYPKASRTDQAGADFVRAGASRSDDLPLYEYDPIGNSPDIKPQAGATEADRSGPKTDAFLEPQAGDKQSHTERKFQKMEPGVYFDEDSKNYFQVGDDGSFKQVEPK